MDQENGTSTLETTSTDVAPVSNEPADGEGNSSPATIGSTEAVSSALDAFHQAGFGKHGKMFEEPAPADSTSKEAKTPDKSDSQEVETEIEPKPESETAPAEVAKSSQVKPRDYSGLDETEKNLFKHVGNWAYNNIYPLYKKLKSELTAAKTDQEAYKQVQGKNFYDHEEAYKLDPAFTQLNQASDRITAELQYWQEQLEAIKTEGGMHTPLYYDPASNTYTQGEPVKPTPAIEAKIIANLAQGQQLSHKLQGELANHQNNFKQQIQSYQQNMKAARDKIVGRLSPEDQTKLEQAANTKLTNFPKIVQGRPEIKMLAELWAINDGLVQYIVQIKGQANGKAIINRTAKNAGPTNVTGSTTPVETIGSAMDAFHKAGYHHR